MHDRTKANVGHLDGVHSEDGYAVGAGEIEQEHLLLFVAQVVKDLPEEAHRGMVGAVAVLVHGVALELVPVVVLVA